MIYKYMNKYSILPSSCYGSNVINLSNNEGKSWYSIIYGVN